MSPAISIQNVSKVYAENFIALKDINLDIHKGEIFALLGPNGAGKTTLIGCICGTIKMTSGVIEINGQDNVNHYKSTRSIVGLVPQEISTEAFETVWATLKFSRGLFGKRRDDHYLQQVLKSLSLWDKKDSQIRFLSGGMKRRLLIAKALSHEPEILFLDEPTAGVDVELRQSMWELVKDLKKRGTTIILTTHYIEEAELMADRVGVINDGKLILVDNKNALMKTLGQKTIEIEVDESLDHLPQDLNKLGVLYDADKRALHYNYNLNVNPDALKELLLILQASHIKIKDIKSMESSLEDIFVNIIKTK
jgi:ABC-2 type transport system ATP-binding protein